jgi:predicted porin
MKKSLLAVAAIGAFASAAQAQSSVTVYGILDVGYIGSNSRAGSTKIQKSAFGQNAETTSRLGFRGTEDLGGGRSAFFTVELGLTPNNSNLSGGTAEDRIQSTSQASGTAIDNRQSFVGLKQNGVGQFAIGRQYTPVFVAGAATSPGQYNNVVGDMVYAGASSVYGSAATTTSGNNNGIGFTNRASNALTVQSDRFGGLVLSAMAAQNNQDTTQTSNAAGGGGQANWNGYGFGGDFRFQKLIVTAGYQSFKTQITNAGSAPTANAVLALGGNTPVSSTLLTVAAQGVVSATSTDDKQTLAGATYDFGILKAYAQWVGRKVNVATGEQVNRNAQQIGVRANITPTIETWASVGNGRIKSAVGGQTANFTGYQLGANYNLSKRTNLYGIFGSTGTSSTAQTLGGANANQYAVGVRHTF